MLSSAQLGVVVILPPLNIFVVIVEQRKWDTQRNRRGSLLIRYFYGSAGSWSDCIHKLLAGWPEQLALYLRCLLVKKRNIYQEAAKVC